MSGIIRLFLVLQFSCLSLRVAGLNGVCCLPTACSLAVSTSPVQNQLKLTKEVPGGCCMCVSVRVCHLPSRRLLEVQPCFGFLKMPVWGKACYLITVTTDAQEDLGIHF